VSNPSITALATPYGKSAIAIIRVSGPQAIEDVSKIFKGTSLKEAPPNTMIYGHIVSEEKNIIDEVMVAVYHAPKSFTAENMIEIFTHGGMFVVSKVLKCLYEVGIEKAKPGEFTERAYLNGRLDLVQAEAVMDIIEAEHDEALKIAHAALQQDVSKRIQSFRETILNWIAHIEVNIDYPEYEEASQLTHTVLQPQITSLIRTFEQELLEAKRNMRMKQGIKTAIIGKPNVGKSSLLNAWIKEDKAIVTDIPGTTRDIVEGHIELKGITLHLLDTAGIHDTDDQVESIGIKKSKQAIVDAELILLVLDQTKSLDESDHTLIALAKNKPHLIIGNKKDIKDNQTGLSLISISARTKEGLEPLEEAIFALLDLGKLDSRPVHFLSNQRHIELIKSAIQDLNQALISIEHALPIDMIQLDLRSAWEHMSDILGARFHEALTDNMFRRFCLGK
jgi:tRNA modification GTPase